MPEGNSGAYVPPNGGDSVWLAGIRITVKLTGEDTGGAYAVTEEITSLQGGAPPHAHDREDEALYVLEGEVEFLLGEDIISMLTHTEAFGMPCRIARPTADAQDPSGCVAGRVCRLVS